MVAPFRLIPNAYKVLMTYMKINGIGHKEDKNVIFCFEKEYDVERYTSQLSSFKECFSKNYRSEISDLAVFWRNGIEDLFRNFAEYIL